MGSVYVALLGAAGHDVWAIDSWAAHVDAMRTNGLRLEGASGDRTVKVNASTRAADAGVCDLVIIATKAMHVEQAAESAKPLLGPSTMVLSIQNGLGGPDTAAKVVGRERVMVGVVGGFGAGGAGFASVSVITLPPQAEREHSRTKRRMGEIVLNIVHANQSPL